jgi:hypothetical protein
MDTMTSVQRVHDLLQETATTVKSVLNSDLSDQAKILYVQLVLTRNDDGQVTHHGGSRLTGSNSDRTWLKEIQELHNAGHIKITKQVPNIDSDEYVVDLIYLKAPFEWLPICSFGDACTLLSNTLNDLRCVEPAAKNKESTAEETPLQ